MGFQIHALEAGQFENLFSLDDDELAKRKACRRTVTEKPGTPCRVSMADAEVGDTVILVNYAHQPADSPFQSTHAIFVRQGVETAKIAANEVPGVLQSRLISLRLFDCRHMMVDALVCPGTELSEAIAEAFENRDVAYAHLHYAKPGCFAASVTRLPVEPSPQARKPR